MRQASTILGIAEHTGGWYLQCRQPSEFGRTYYSGISVQSVNKQLRAAMLGNSWEYDIRSSVIAWKMGFARSCQASQHAATPVSRLFRATLHYLENKKDFVRHVCAAVFDHDSACNEEL